MKNSDGKMKNKNKQNKLTPLISALSGAFQGKSRQTRDANSAMRRKPESGIMQSVKFESLEPRVLMAGDVNPGALTISGNLAVQGQQDSFEFTVEEPTRVVFDSLTNRPDLTWKLDGAQGEIAQRSFNLTADRFGSPAFELGSGNYRLTVDGNTDAAGEYALRAIDADAAADLVPGTVVSETLDSGNKTAVYRFDATAGDEFYFKSNSVSGGELKWRLIDPFGRQEGSVLSASTDKERFAVQLSGAYLLLLEGADDNKAPVAYSFNLQRPQDSTAAMALDTTTVASIDQFGKRANFTFSLAQATKAMFDELSGPAQLNWTLTGPGGEQITRQKFHEIPSATESAWMDLTAGDYTLTIDADAGVLGDATFRLLSETVATELELGVTNFFGTDRFTYKLSNCQLVSNSAAVNTVGAVNVAPVAKNGQVTMPEDTAFAVAVLPLASDVDSTTLTATIVDGPQHGKLTLNVDGSYTYTPNANFYGIDKFLYKVNDGELDSEVATVVITVNPVDDAPVAGNLSVVLAENTSATIDALAACSDVDGDTLAVALVDGPQHGTATLNADGTFTYVPTAGYYGTDSFTYRAIDGRQNSGIAKVSITVTPLYEVPVASDIAATTDEDSGVLIDLLGNVSGIDRAALTAVIVSGSAHGTVSLNPDGSVNYTPDANYHGQDSFTYRIDNGPAQSNLATVTLTVTAVNDKPVAANATVQQDEDTPFTFSLQPYVSDVDGDVLAITVGMPQYGTVSANADGSFTYTPNANYFGTDSFTYRANDGQLDSQLATVTLTIAAVNDAPVATDLTLTTAEDSVLTINLLTQGSDVDSTLLTSHIVNGPTHGTLTANADGSYYYTPTANYNGTDHFTFVISDGDQESNVATVLLNITAVNDAPTAVDTLVLTNEDTPLTLHLAANGTDIDSTTLTANIVDGPLHGTLVANADGSFTYVPAANYFGTDSITYRISDGELQSNLATLVINVAPVNSAPVWTSTPPARFDAPTSSQWGDEVVQVPGQPGTQVTIDCSWLERHTSYENEIGVYLVDDATGRIGNLLPGDRGYAQAALSAERAKVIFNQGQTAGATNSLVLMAGQHVGFYLIANGSTEEWRSRHPLGEKLNKSPRAYFSIPEANYRKVDHLRGTWNAQGQLTLHWEDQRGADEKDHKYSKDHKGHKDHKDHKGHKEYKDYNDAVISINGLGSAQSASFVYNAHATDADGDSLTYHLLEGPAGAYIDSASGQLVWNTPIAGSHLFRLQVSDGNGGIAEQSFTLEVGIANTPPVAQSASIAVYANYKAKIDLNKLISDPDGDSLTVTTGSPAHGTLTMQKDGSYLYVPSKYYVGTDSFTYTVSDGKAVTTARIDILVRKKGGHKNYDSSESIVVKSMTALSAEARPDQLVLQAQGNKSDKGSKSMKPVIDWDGARKELGVIPVNYGKDWICEMLGAGEDEDLLSLTGLKVQLKQPRTS